MKAATVALMFPALSGCHQPSPQKNGATPVALSADGYLKRVNGLPQKQRDIVFFHVIDDAGFACQGVGAPEPRPEVQGYPAWTAHCVDGRDWVVVLEKNGIVQVATPAQVRGVRATAPKTADLVGNESGR